LAILKNPVFSPWCRILHGGRSFPSLALRACVQDITLAAEPNSHEFSYGDRGGQVQNLRFGLLQPNGRAPYKQLRLPKSHPAKLPQKTGGVTRWRGDLRALVE
jgi:hypothetical protein